MTEPTIPFGLARIFRAGWQLWKKRPAAWALLGVATVLPFVVNNVYGFVTIPWHAREPLARALGALVSAIGFVMASPPTTSPPAPRIRWGSVIVTSLIAGGLMGVGYSYYAVPGLVVQCGLWPAAIIAAAEDRSPLRALARSMDLTKGRRLELFAIGTMFLLTGAGLAFLTGRYGYGWSWQERLIIPTLVDGLLAAYATLVCITSYRALVREKLGPTQDEVEAVFT